MLTLLKKIFTWWNQDTFGTRLKTIFFGKLVGTDQFGNKYYSARGKSISNLILKLKSQKLKILAIYFR